MIKWMVGANFIVTAINVGMIIMIDFKLGQISGLLVQLGR